MASNNQSEGEFLGTALKPTRLVVRNRTKPSYIRGGVTLKAVQCIKLLRRGRHTLEAIEQHLGVKSQGHKTGRRYLHALEEAYVPVMYMDVPSERSHKRIYWIPKDAL